MPAASVGAGPVPARWPLRATLRGKTTRQQNIKTTTMMPPTSKQQCAAAPLPVRGGVRGGVCIFSPQTGYSAANRILQTPPLAPSLEGRGAAVPSSAAGIAANTGPDGPTGWHGACPYTGGLASSSAALLRMGACAQDVVRVLSLPIKLLLLFMLSLNKIRWRQALPRTLALTGHRAGTRPAPTLAASPAPTLAANTGAANVQ